MTIPASIATTLQRIAKDFCRAQASAHRKPSALIVTSATRSTSDEASELQKRLEAGSDLKYYENKEAVAEIVAAHKKGFPLKDVLDSQVQRGCYVSKHLFDRAVDISRPKDMSQASLEAFRSIATREGTLIVEDEGGVEDHFHLNFPPYPGDPKKCPGSG